MREYSIGLPLGLEQSLPIQDLADLERRGNRLAVKQGELIYRQGEDAAHVFLLLSGRVKSLMVNSSGQETLLRLHLSGNILGLTALASTPIREADAVAMEPAVLVAIGRAEFLSILEGSSAIAVRLVRLLVDRMSDFHHRVAAMSALTVEQRMAQALLSLSRNDPQTRESGRRPVALTHEELAQLLGARRPTVSATLTRLAEAGMIHRQRGRIEIIDDVGLAALLPDEFHQSLQDAL